MTAADSFFHVRILVGIVTGLSVSRLLTGLARPVQRPDLKQMGFVHAAWAVYLLLTIIHFWWFELALSKLVEKWTFGLYVFVIGYASLLFLISTILFPDQTDQHSDPEAYFYSRRAWFYGMLATMFLVDICDTMLKGVGHFQALGVEYPIRQAVLLVLSLIAIFVRRPLYHASFVALGILYQLSWAVRQFDVLS